MVEHVRYLLAGDIRTDPNKEKHLMLIKFHEREDTDEEGFTLIQMVIVVAIIGILALIGLPAFGQVQSMSTVGAIHANNKIGVDMVTAQIMERTGFINKNESGLAAFRSMNHAAIGSSVTEAMSTDGKFETYFGFPITPEGDLVICATTWYSPNPGETSWDDMIARTDSSDPEHEELCLPEGYSGIRGGTGKQGYLEFD